MLRPRLAPFFEVMRNNPNAVQGFDRAGVDPCGELFVVTSDGYCMGYWWKSGDIVVCTPVQQSIANVVLMPKGYGWPRLGRQASYGSLFGDAGEPCRLDRWAVVGAIECVLRRGTADVWNEVLIGAQLEEPGAVEDNWDQPIKVARKSVHPVAGWGDIAAAAVECGRQLSLFTRPAIAA